jgi:hypothetical protein
MEKPQGCEDSALRYRAGLRIYRAKTRRWEYSEDWLCRAADSLAGWGAAVLRPYLEAACFAALWPHMPWTPPPGGVEDEQI